MRKQDYDIAKGFILGVGIGAFIIISMLLAGKAQAEEYGYSLIHQNLRPNVTESARGFEGRINFGGGVTDRYSGDKFSIAIGHAMGRATDGDEWIRVPTDTRPNQFGRVPAGELIDGYQYINLTHRWYTKTERFKWAPQLRMFVGTGVAWRNAHTCVDQGCWNGTPAVSSRWAFHQSFGFKWRERVEIAWGHDSTGKISTLNFGDDVIRFTMYALIGDKR